jgi:hypothetical protein
LLHQFNGSQRIGVGHVWPRQMDSLYGKLGLANAVIAGCLGILESLPDCVIKVRVHEGMRAQPAAKEKPRPKPELVKNRVAAFHHRADQETPATR